MKISLRWLSEYVSYQFPPKELADRLTALGIEVESIEDFSSKFAKILVGEVLSVTPHPNADKLRLTTVSIGSGAPLNIVCGAPNVRIGLKVAVATIGADLGDGFVIKKSKIRGEASEGMLCSERELGLSENHEGIWELPSDLEIGKPLAEAIGKDDIIFEIGLTPNRADCLSHIGIAREVAVLTGGRIKKPAIEKKLLTSSSEQTDNAAKVTISDPDLCPRYAARIVRGVRVGPSPEWLREKLESIGLRPRNNIVDITNFVLMECGHPLHAFDLNSVADAHIIVRRAEGFAKNFVTLDGKQRSLDPSTLLIADQEKPLAIAGIMGGQNSEISDSTTNVLIESAYFNPASIRRSAKRLGLSTDASHRFERGTDIENVIFAVDRAAALMAELAGGEVLQGIIDEYPEKRPQKSFPFRPKRAEALLGRNVAESEMEKIFSSLEIGRRKTHASWDLTPPSWRVDLEQEVDAIEEIARVIGYDALPASREDRIPITKVRDVLPKRDFDADLRSYFVDLGFSECISTPMLPKNQAEIFHSSPIEVMNPLTVELERMRPSILPNLLDIARRNERYGASGQRLFEAGSVFNYADTRQTIAHAHERWEIAVLIKDDMEMKNPYNVKEQKADIFYLRGVIESALRHFGISVLVAPLSESSPVGNWVNARSYLDATETLIFKAGKTLFGLAGRLSGVVQKEYDLRSEAFVAVLDYEMIHELARARMLNPPRVTELPRFPEVERDIAITLSRNVDAQRLIDEIGKTIPRDLFEGVRIFDEFESKEMKMVSERSLGLRISMRAQDRTLEDAEIDEIMSMCVGILTSKFSARLRS
ncbi:MAG: phenylalanine--tRNA ligase subunit beta [Bacteroidota bacterium]|nr:phenylalanine--tRNA ligase subunit beta [Bacteroidota bacterium]MDP4230125.1 phenylalanine--tRNA ligase subunit beta [Bacteroidota bacterium]MDP4236607.1 phenylalanine--tRNA ligase subunit beta [Bacteroidota bacterium]